MIVIRGRNHYPQDIEATVERAHPSVRPHCSAAFAVEIEGQERLVVVAEVERHARRCLNVAQIAGDVRQAVSAQHGLQAHVCSTGENWKYSQNV